MLCFESVKAILALYKVLFEKYISIATDGASVMTGIRSGVTTRLGEQNPFIIKSQCCSRASPCSFTGSQFR